jgi:hypothetical protein
MTIQDRHSLIQGLLEEDIVQRLVVNVRSLDSRPAVRVPLRTFNVNREDVY